MKFFTNLKIRVKIIIGFIIMIILTGAICLVSITNMERMNEGSEVMYINVAIPLQNLSKVAESHQKQKVFLREIFIADTLEERNELHNNIKELNEVIHENAKLYEASIIDPKGKVQYAEFEKCLLDEFEPARDATVQLLLDGQDEAAKIKLYDELQPIANKVSEMMDGMFDFKINASADRYDANVKATDEAMYSMIAIVAVGIVTAIVLGLYISSIIGRPVNKLVKVADQLAMGDVDVNIDINSKDEVGHLAEAFKAMIANIRYQAHVAQRISEGDLSMEVEVKSNKDLLGKSLHTLVEQNNEILSNIKSSAEQLAIGAKQVSDYSVALSHGATEQASSIEELTASMEQMSAQTKLTADNSTQANELGRQAIDKAEIGTNQMKEMLRAMDEISISSNNINKIIKVIGDIAFQTNILALNAAVEAARVGQYGKGFAVVAEEVRTLAARSADAANETTELIRNSIMKVEEGTKIAKSTAESLSEIVTGIDKAAELVGEIATASNEQAIGVEQINQGIMQVSNVVQTNSATSEEGAATSEELSSQAEMLTTMVSKYKLKDQHSKGSNIDRLNPELISMLESMADKQKSMKQNNDSSVVQQNSKIILSDYDFGKY